jgi:hypothetical protein
VPVTLTEPTATAAAAAVRGGVAADTESNPFGYIHYMDSSCSPDPDSAEQQHNLLIEDDDLITLVLPGSDGEVDIGREDVNNGGDERDELQLVEYESEEMLFLLPKSLLRSPSLRSSGGWSSSTCVGQSAAMSANQDDYTVSSLCLSQEEDSVHDGQVLWPPAVVGGEQNHPTAGGSLNQLGCQSDYLSRYDQQWGSANARLQQPPVGSSFDRWVEEEKAMGPAGGWQSPCRGRVPRVASTSASEFHRATARPRVPSQLLQHSVSVPVLPQHHHRSGRGDSRGERKLSKFSERRKVVLSSSESESEADSPPSWLSCFSSPRSKRKMSSKAGGPGFGSSEPSLRRPDQLAARVSGPIRFIDETPSGSSADLIYGSPILVDYENFNRREFFSDRSSQQKARGPRRKSRSLSRPRVSQQGMRAGGKGSVEKSFDYLAIDAARLRLAEDSLNGVPARPNQISVVSQRLTSQTPVNQLHHGPSLPAGGYQITTRAVVEENSCLQPLSPPPGHGSSFGYYQESNGSVVPYARRCTCESRRSSDSGLADVSAHADACPLSPLLGKGSLQSVTSLPNSSAGGYYPSSPHLSRRQSSAAGGGGGRPLGSVATGGSPRVASDSRHITSDFIMNNSRERFSDLSSVRQDVLHISNNQRPSSVSLNGPIVSADSLTQHPLYRCSCGQEIRWGAASAPFQPDLVSKAMPPTGENRLPSVPKAALQYSASLDDLAVRDEGSGGGLGPRSAVSFDQALSCSDIPASVRVRPPPFQQASPKPAYFSPPMVRHSTQQTLVRSDQRFSAEEEEASTTAARSSWQRTKETYKSGLYAHWWLNASLQPIWEETFEPSGLTAFQPETSL